MSFEDTKGETQMGLIEKTNNLRIADNSSLNSNELNDRQSPSPK